MLTAEMLNSFYGRAHILHDLSFSVAAGQVLVLLGRNGAGKSTTLKSVIGLVRPASGSIRYDGAEIAGHDTHRIARQGIGYVAEERRIFGAMTVRENLEVGRQRPRGGVPPWTPERLFALFPNLAPSQDRLAARMSGGEQQMLAIARCLMGNPRLVLLDEPAEGLAPLVVQQVAASILALKAAGVSILLAEQNLRLANAVADQALVIEQGRGVWHGAMTALTMDVQDRYLAVAA